MAHSDDNKEFTIVTTVDVPNLSFQIPAGEDGKILEHSEDGKRIKVMISQYNNNQPFWIPICITVNGKEQMQIRILGPYVDFPFRVIADWTSKPPNSISIKKGDLGQIFAVGSGNQVKASIPRYKDPINIPRDRIKVGSQRVRPGHWKLHRNQQLVNVPRITQTLQGSQLWRTVFHFFDALRNVNIPQMTSGLRRLLGSDNNAIANFANIIVDGCKKAGTLQTFNTTKFTLTDICNAGQLIGRNQEPNPKLVNQGNPAKAVIYIMQHEKFKKNPRPSAFYTGESGNSPERSKGHSSSAVDTSQTSYHYSIWRATNRHRMVNICSMPVGSGDNETVRFGAELFFIAALDSYAPKLIHEYAKFVAEESAEPNSAFLENSASFAAEDKRVGADVAKGLAMIEFQDIAFRVMSFSEDIFKQVGWPRGASRTSFGASAGCNVDTPLGRTGDGDVVYYKTTIPGVMEQYRSRPSKCNQWHRSNAERGKKDLIEVGHFGAHRFTLATRREEGGPRPGDQVHTVFEIWDMKQDVPQASWARLPSQGEMSDHQLARRLRIAIEWVDSQTGENKRLYLLSSCIDNIGANRPPNSYIKAMTFIHGLRQETIPQNRPPWMTEEKLPVVLDATWSHLDQTLTLSSTNSKSINAPRQVDREQREKALRDVGAKNFGGEFGQVPPSKTKKTGPKRKTCDRCYVGNKANLGRKAGDVVPTCDVNCACTKSDSKDSNSACTRCKNLHRMRCSWTADDQITKEYEDAVLHERETPYSTAVDVVSANDTLDLSIMSTASRSVQVANPLKPVADYNTAIAYKEVEILAALKTTSISKLETATRMCIAGVKALPDKKLNDMESAYRQALLVRLVERLTTIPDDKLQQSQKNTKQECLEQIENLQDDLPLTFESNKFRDKNGENIKNRPPKTSEVANFIEAQQWTKENNRNGIYMLGQWIWSVGKVKGVDTAEQEAYINKVLGK